ncbi:hypothetical protein LCGC14_1171680 [marine sediment metagenome]|uniref:Uncharacterized protein n=1 Tax=marine sediment metagenome TaxID=412755 RepID=A0A0F9PV65_9ZZZZ
MLYQHFKGVPFDAYVALVNKLKKQALEEMGLPEDEIVVRPLRPEDVGFANPVYTSTIAAGSTAAYSNFINTYTIADNRYIGIFGVGYDNSENNVTALRFTREGKTARIWSIQQVADFEDKVGYGDDPITVEQNTQITIEKYSITTTDSDTTSLVGVVVEKRGLLINP